MFVLTNALYLILVCFISPTILYQAIRHGRYKRGWREKIFGASTIVNRTGFKTVWLHAVSVGEVQLMRTVVRALENRRPDLPFVISTSTDSGYDLARESFPEHPVFFAPFDFSWAIKESFRRINPSLILLMELEVWPNWLKEAEKQGCPVLVLNGRLSEKSFRGYRKISWIMKPILRSLDWVGAQNQTYADRFLQLGVEPSAISVTGSIKFDGAEPDRSATEILERRKLLGLCEDDIVWVAGSTQEPEEDLVLNAFLKISPEFPNLKLLIVPRHRERFGEIAKLIQSKGRPWAKRSDHMNSAPDPGWTIFLGDTIGELKWWWGLASIGFVGGSFGNRGGQNMIEPCAYGVATSFGPNTKNFADIVGLLHHAKACKQFMNEEELLPWVREMVANSTLRNEIGDRAKTVTASHRGALDRTLAAIENFLPQPDNPV
jgi:3-deoxy-D-manno-octulosonic-acid transferase